MKMTLVAKLGNYPHIAGNFTPIENRVNFCVGVSNQNTLVLNSYQNILVVSPFGAFGKFPVNKSATENFSFRCQLLPLCSRRNLSNQARVSRALSYCSNV